MTRGGAVPSDGGRMAAAGWGDRISAANALVERWIQAVTPAAWTAARGHPWTRKDLLGHLAAWSDLLLDQVEALQQGRPGDIERVDIDEWNAVQVAKRKTWTVRRTIAAWRRSASRAAKIVRTLPRDTKSRRWPVAWSDEPASVDDVLNLLLVHLEQHRRDLTSEPRPPDDDFARAPARSRGRRAATRS